MSRTKVTFWQKYKYWLSGLLLVFPVWYFYQSLHFDMTEALATQQIGEFSIAPMPNDYEAPYEHDGIFVKDFLLLFEQGDINQIRQAYLNIGPQALPLKELQTNDLGILHGTRHGQHVHALSSPTVTSTDKIWLTIESWQGDLLIASWEPPAKMLNTH